MGLHPLDWSIVVGYMVLAVGIGLFLRRRAGKGLSNYFLSNRSFPWWLVGTSMVATTFSADTPLAVTGLIAKNGIAGNWFWWITGLSTLTVTFFFARWWHRSRVLTDVEYLELRYSGRSAAALRGFAALYRGLLLNAIKLGWVLLAMAKVLDTIFDVNKETALLISLLIVLIYSTMSGFWGVVVLDFFAFLIAMLGCIALAVLSVKHIGGMDALHSGLMARFGEKGAMDMMAIFPSVDSAWMPLFTVVVYFGILWWADARVEGGAYVAQRLMASKNEKHATLASLWFTFANIALRPWPWVIIALASFVVFPDLADKEAGFPMMMKTVLPIGLRGLMVTAFFAAFMSTIDTLVNWGSSYVVNDFYKRFFAREKGERHYVIAAKFCEAGLLCIGYFVSLKASSVSGMWQFIVDLTAGLGVVYVARWLWWRVNAWSEIAAMTASGATTILLKIFTDLDFAHSLVVILAVTTASWVTVTFLTSPVSMEKLTEFYRRVRPYPLFWKPVLANIDDPAERHCPDDFFKNVRCWAISAVALYSMLFAIGKWVLWVPSHALALTLLCAVSLVLLWNEMRERRPQVEEAPAIAKEPALESD
ncbi:MAG: Na+:solute symporter [Proteobacteria bacterium]|nr:Na+:solute symporter [Pseudomonadota bacterium]